MQKPRRLQPALTTTQTTLITCTPPPHLPLTDTVLLLTRATNLPPLTTRPVRRTTDSQLAFEVDPGYVYLSLDKTLGSYALLTGREQVFVYQLHLCYDGLRALLSPSLVRIPTVIVCDFVL